MNFTFGPIGFICIIVYIIVFTSICTTIIIKYIDNNKYGMHKTSSNFVIATNNRKYNNITLFQPNPVHSDGADCFIRALCKYYGKTWDEIYDILSLFAKTKKLILDNQKVVLSYFEENGFNTKLIEHKNISFSKACKTYSKQYDKFFLLGNNHIVCCENGVIYDSWDSRDLKVFYLITKKKENNKDRMSYKLLKYMSKCHRHMSKWHKN